MRDSQAFESAQPSGGCARRFTTSPSSPAIATDVAGSAQLRSPAQIVFTSLDHASSSAGASAIASTCSTQRSRSRVLPLLPALESESMAAASALALSPALSSPLFPDLEDDAWRNGTLLPPALSQRAPTPAHPALSEVMHSSELTGMVLGLGPPSPSPQSSPLPHMVQCPHCHACFDSVQHAVDGQASNGNWKRKKADGDAARYQRNMSMQVTVNREDVIGLNQDLLRRVAGSLGVRVKRGNGRTQADIRDDVLKAWPSSGRAILLE